MTSTARTLRSRGVGAIAALEFRIGLYAWLTRIFPAQPWGALGAVAFLLLAGVAATEVTLLADQQYAQDPSGWAVVLVSLGRALIILTLAGMWTYSDTPPFGRRSSRHAFRQQEPRSHLAQLLPLSSLQREGAVLLGRLFVMAVLAAPGLALIAAAAHISPAGRVGFLGLSEAAWSAILIVATLLLSRFGAPGTSLATTGVLTMSWLPILLNAASAPGDLGQAPDFLRTMLLLWVAPAPVSLAVRAARAGWLALRRHRLAAASEPVTELPESFWVRRDANWRRACTPEAGRAAWARALGRVVAEVALGGALGIVVLSVLHPGWAHFVAGASLLVVPGYGGALGLLTWSGGMLETGPRWLRDLLPESPRTRWRTTFGAALLAAVVFAGLGELLGAGGLLVARALSGKTATVPEVLYWMPPGILLASLIAWAQTPFLRHPHRIIAHEQDFWWACAFAVVMLLLALPLVLFLAAETGGAVLPCLALLAGLAGVMQALSYRSATSDVWQTGTEAGPSDAARREAHSAVLLAAGSLALAVGCLLAMLIDLALA
jgi:hypothetical protein